MTSKLALTLALLSLAVVPNGCGGSSTKPHDSGADSHPDTGAGGTPADAGGDAETGASSFSVGGTVAGLAGTGLILADAAGHQIPIAGNGTFVFPSPLAAGSSTTVTVAQQPTMPSQVCTVTGGVVTAIAANVTSVMVSCVTTSFTVAGTLSGLTGAGLVLQDNGGDDLAVTANGVFTFPKAIDSGATFTVSVKTQPTTPSQTCQVSGGSGTIGGANITSVAINCDVNAFTIGGTTTGLVGTGLVLQNEAGDDLSLTTNGVFAFAKAAHSGDAFAVTVKTQPAAPVQTCVVSQGSGTAATGNVTTVAITCTTNVYTVGGTVTGLVGSGLVLQNKLGDNVNVAAAGAFTFATAIASGAMYAVTVLTQPSSPSQTCTVTGGGGTIGAAAVTAVSVACTTSTFKIGGTVSGLLGAGLKLQNQGADDLVLTASGALASGAFTFETSQPSGTPFAVTIAAQPTNPDQTCTLSGATGTVGGAPVTSVIVNCDTNRHVVGGTVANLAGTGLTLSLNGGTAQAVSSNGAFAFAGALPSGGTYSVVLASQPTTPSQTCVVTGGTGTIASSDITTVAVACTTNSYVVKATVSGLLGTGLKLKNNATDELPVAADGTVSFTTAIASGQSYAVTVSGQPTVLSQTCVVTNPTGTVTGGDVTNVAVTCTTNKYVVGGTIAGLAGTVAIKNGAGDSLTLTANGAFAFPTSLPSGALYAVAVVTQPATPDQLCAVANGSGSVTNGAVTDVSITCVTNAYKIGGTLVGLTGGGLVLQDNAGDDLIVAGGTTFTFATAIASGAGYAVTIKTQPSVPTQTCVVVGGTGSVGASDVTSVTVNCSTNSFVVGGTVTGLFGDGLVLQNNAAGDVAVSGSGSFAFTPPLLSGQVYAVTVKTNPTDPWQTCTVTGGSGTVTNKNVSVQITCVSNPYPVSVSVTNLSGGGLVLQNNAGDSLPVAADGTYLFATLVRSGLTYAVTVLSQPTNPWQTCVVSMPAGSIAGAGVTVAVNCVTNTYTITGSVSGLEGTGLVLRDNGADDLPISNDGNFTFATPIASGAPYVVTVGVSPTGPAQTCVVTNGSGTPNVFNVNNVKVACANVLNCGAVDEGQTLMLACPVDQTIGAITFASYGTPGGTCGAFTLGACDATNSVSILTAACGGKQACSVAASNGIFGDPCGGTFKRLWVQFSCQ